jgi:polyhydroxyalkanoate synthase
MTAMSTPVFPSGSPPEVLPPPPSPPVGTRAADLDRILHDWQSGFTGGTSPSTLGLAFLDWAAHAANAPFQTAELGRTAIEQWFRLWRAMLDFR